MTTDGIEAAFFHGVAADLSLLARLHDRELSPELAVELQDAGFPTGLTLRLTGEPASETVAALAQEVADWTRPMPDAQQQAFAAEYAAIYLNNYCNASPQASYWLDEDHLVRQEPMFAVRRYYQRYGLEVADWRQRADDHIVPELEFLALLMAGEEPLAELPTVAEFLDHHLLSWIGDFASRVARRCTLPFYGGLALLTHYYCDRLRDVIAAIENKPRPSRDAVLKRLKREQAAPAPVKFMPGVGPSW